jgi:hypothetical protein
MAMNVNNVLFLLAKSAPPSQECGPSQFSERVLAIKSFPLTERKSKINNSGILITWLGVPKTQAGVQRKRDSSNQAHLMHLISHPFKMVSYDIQPASAFE